MGARLYTTAVCEFCRHRLRVVAATSRQINRYVNTRQPGAYYVGTCPACQMRDCHHEETVDTPAAIC